MTASIVCEPTSFSSKLKAISKKNMMKKCKRIHRIVFRFFKCHITLTNCTYIIKTGKKILKKESMIQPTNVNKVNCIGYMTRIPKFKTILLKFIPCPPLDFLS